MSLVSGATPYLETALLNHVLRNTAYTPAANRYLALYTDFAGTQELAVSGYTRQAVTFSAASNRQSVHSGTVSWTVSADWGTIKGAAVVDALTGGNQLFFGPLTTAQLALSGNTLAFNSTNTFAVELGGTGVGGASDYLAPKLLDLVLRGTAYASPATVYAGLLTNYAGTGNTPNLIEPTATGYIRKAMAFAAPSGGVCTNSGTVSWATVAAAYGRLVGAGIWDASSAGNNLFWGPFTGSSAWTDVYASDTFQFDTSNTYSVVLE